MNVVGPARRAELEDEAAFLHLSLEDLDRELAAGELVQADYDSLRARYEERTAAVAKALDQLGAPAAGSVSSRPQRRRLGVVARRHRVVLGWAAACCFGLAGILIGLTAAGVPPFAGAAPPLSLSARINIELAEASVLAGHHHVALAIDTYNRVLALDPRQPEALTQAGWLVRLAGLSASRPSLVAQGDREIAAAAVLDPRYALARGYEGVVLLEDAHEPRAAATSFAVMLADHPSAALIASVRAEAVKAFAAAHEPLPKAFGR